MLDTALGDLLMVADGDALTGLYFPEHWHPPVVDSVGPRVGFDEDATLAEASSQVLEYLRGDRRSFDLQTATAGNPLQERVWALLARLPFGTTTTYGALAAELGDPHLAQSVGQAVGRNPISIVIPCHRVLGHDGRLTGYAGGLSRKHFLLDLEEPVEIKAERLF